MHQPAMFWKYQCSGSMESQALHCHEQLEFVGVMRGTGRLRVANRTQRTQPSFISCIGPQEIHAGSPSTEDFAVRGFNVSAHLLESLGVNWEDFLERVDDVQNERVTRSFNSLFLGYGRDGCELKNNELLLSFAAAFRKGGAPASRKELPKIRTAIDFLRANLHENYNVSDLASVVGLAPSYFCRAFRQSTGLPPHAYRQRLRVARAVTLLHQGISASEVAIAVGFYDQSHLSRHMKSQLGDTPNQIIKKVNSVLFAPQSSV